MLQAIAKCKAIRVSPSKLGLVANSIKGMSVNEALLQLQFSRKSVALDVKHVLNSAISNAENNHSMDIDNLFISQIYCGKYKVMKRHRARARGRAGKIQKFFSNLTIILKERS